MLEKWKVVIHGEPHYTNILINIVKNL